jgi:hypothetical protein
MFLKNGLTRSRGTRLPSFGGGPLVDMWLGTQHGVVGEEFADRQLRRWMHWNVVRHGSSVRGLAAVLGFGVPWRDKCCKWAIGREIARMLGSR